MQPNATCSADVHALDVGSLHASSAAAISDLQSPKQLCSVVLAARRQVCRLARQPGMQVESPAGGVALAQAPLHDWLAVWQVPAAVASAVRQG